MIKDTDLHRQMQPGEPQAGTSSQQVANPFKGLTEEVQTLKRRELMREHYTKMAHMPPTRPEDPWDKRRKDAVVRWLTVTQALSCLGEALKDPSGGAAALHLFHAAVDHLQDYEDARRDQIRSMLKEVKDLEEEKRDTYCTPLSLGYDDYQWCATFSTSDAVEVLEYWSTTTSTTSTCTQLHQCSDGKQLASGPLKPQEIRSTSSSPPNPRTACRSAR